MQMKNSDLRICFFGTDEIAVAVLEELLSSGITPALIVTAPDRKQGRGMVLTPPPIKMFADEQDIDVLQPETLKDESFISLLQNSEWDVFIVVSYGKIIPQSIIDIPRKGILNVHPSLLPKLRGPSPIRTAILKDMKETGVSVMLLDEQMDHGPILAQAKIEIEDWPLSGSELDQLLAHEGGQLLAEVVLPWVEGKVEAEEQDHEAATFSTFIKKSDGLLDLSDDPYTNYLKIQAYDGWPGTFFMHATEDGREMRLKITEASFDPIENTLIIERVIPEGKKEIEFKDFRKN